VDFSISRKRGGIPTQAFSEFLIKKQQGEWAENLILEAINDIKGEFVAVKYGKSDEIIGKRPDLLVFLKKDFGYSEFDISNFKESELRIVVQKAIAGLEVRSSAYLVHKYVEFSEKRKNEIWKEISEIRNLKMGNYYFM